ncbi:hypothetical protein [uncultured Neptuniibacter sp.]|uniref:hypothetical protein n=1 Tax=uncultured Neptuniibacter sp. TaxID=502143 RepID=UPI002637EEE6|nr:hypothetical protein [uncultured Neptuniibacter sp.]
MLRLGLILLIIPSLALMTVFYIDQSAVDSCLDAGGSYNYQAGECDFEQKHQFYPIMARYPLLVNGAMLLSVIGLLLCMKGLLWRPVKEN